MFNCLCCVLNIATANQIVRRIKRNFLFFSMQTKIKKAKNVRAKFFLSFQFFSKILLTTLLFEPLGQNPTFSEQKAKRSTIFFKFRKTKIEKLNKFLTRPKRVTHESVVVRECFKITTFIDKNGR